MSVGDQINQLHWIGRWKLDENKLWDKIQACPNIATQVIDFIVVYHKHIVSLFPNALCKLL